MRILLTNDDGIAEDGLSVLSEYLGQEHEVWIIAPDRNRSGVSHGISMRDPLEIKQINDKIFSCSGVPADCVITGLQAILPEFPDMVLSGINRGANIGTDIIYSGTAAAARQAVLAGIPAAALSIDSDDHVWRYHALADFVLKNITQLRNLCTQDVFLNINAKSADSYIGCKMTAVSLRQYGDSVHLYKAPDGRLYSFFQGGCVHTEGDELSDYYAVQNGYISISPIYAHPATAPLENVSLDNISV